MQQSFAVERHCWLGFWALVGAIAVQTAWASGLGEHWRRVRGAVHHKQYVGISCLKNGIQEQRWSRI